MQQGVELGTQALAYGGGKAHQLVGEWVKGVAHTVEKQRPQALGGAVKAIDEDALDPVRGLMYKGRPLTLAVRLGESHRTFGVAVAQVMSED